jgi:hypothetical protein
MPTGLAQQAQQLYACVYTQSADLNQFLEAQAALDLRASPPVRIFFRPN